MSGIVMESEDFIAQKNAEIAALQEEITFLRVRVERAERQAAERAEWKERAQRLLVALDESLARERARNEARRQEQEALEL
jgi:hypothetical protein